jgi:ABC-type Zn uptake system ZnuABC Zn-binding protein ZnuA
MKFDLTKQEDICKAIVAVVCLTEAFIEDDNRDCYYYEENLEIVKDLKKVYDELASRMTTKNKIKFVKWMEKRGGCKITF